MTVSIKIPALVLTLAALAGPALAQTTPPAPGASQSRSLAPSGGAAATLPNTFDSPTAPVTPTAPLPAAPGGQVSDAQMAEAALRSVIEQLKAGDIQEAMFTPDLGGRLNTQMSTFSPIVQGFGDLQTIEPSGVKDGVAQYVVTFNNAATQWLIGLEEGGLIAALLFRPAPPESSEPSSPDA